MVLDMFAVIFGGAAALLPIYAQEILRVGPRGYGLLSSSLEIGAIATSVVLMTRPPVRRTGRTLLLGRRRVRRGHHRLRAVTLVPALGGGLPCSWARPTR
jgi:hypothetical protein